MRDFLVYTVFYTLGIYQASSAQEAKDLCAIDAGYLSESDMVKRLNQPSELLVRELEEFI